MPNRTMLCLAALLTLCALATANAQQQRPVAPSPPASQPSPQPSPRTSSETPSRPAVQVSEEEADLAITANVTASSLMFEAVPNVSVEFPGKPRRETVWEAERTNLPRPVQPGVTYRDVGVRLKIVSVFADIDRIVAEALGEVPPSNDQTQPSAPPSASDTARTERAAATNNARPRASASRRTRALPVRRQR